jgi:hypothetical protein
MLSEPKWPMAAKAMGAAVAALNHTAKNLANEI